MSTTVDHAGLLRLLHENEGYSLPFAVRPARRGEDLVRFLSVVRVAIDSANVVAVRRCPSDPTWCAEATLAGSVVIAELAKGDLTDDEVVAWLDDFTAALGDERAKVLPHPPDRRLPNFDDWLELPPSITAFLDFVPADPQTWLWRTRLDVLDVAEDLVEWTRVPGATTVVQRGLVSLIAPLSAGVRELRTSAELEPEWGLQQFTRKPRRARTFQVVTRAKGYLQIIDETTPRLGFLPHLLDGLRILAPYLQQAHVRPGQTTVPNERDTSRTLKRPLTKAEDLVTLAPYAHLLGSYVRGAYVAQVLTSAHLDKIGHPAGFDIENLGHDRYLVVATDPGGWLDDLNPDPQIEEEARRAFAPAILTAEIAERNRRQRP